MANKIYLSKLGELSVRLDKNISIQVIKSIYKWKNVCLDATFCPNYQPSHALR
ncbi:hypothetical protein XSR1_330004 [Xenorhabdus szentirmaii DSM 16338]|uniref:Uncharacterized protein n=1 Tax=Xenorhabdus szentirmaii DSM 16338 TaxID=1427518 RepID=W1IYQ2_9GAMM|nr:hypothetical protein XSR1_330004 [Xenorhabdus szentirmaii DSM 16338]